jgi:hypothetical protein
MVDLTPDQKKTLKNLSSAVVNMERETVERYLIQQTELVYQWHNAFHEMKEQVEELQNMLIISINKLVECERGNG